MDWENVARLISRPDPLAHAQIERFLATMADNVSFADADVGHIHGRERLREYLHASSQKFPTWSQELIWMQTGDDWGVFETIGRGLYLGRGTPPEGIPVVVELCSIARSDEKGLIVRWQDFAGNDVAGQIRAGVRAASTPTA